MRNHRTPARRFLPSLGLLVILTGVLPALAADNPFIGDWELTIPGGGAGWLGVEESNGKRSASVLWGGGSVLPVQGVKVEGNTLVVTREQAGRRGGAATVETITATREGDNLKLTTVKKRPDGSEFGKADFTGKLQPPMPAAP